MSLLLDKIWFNMAIHGGVRREMAAVPKLNFKYPVQLVDASWFACSVVVAII